MKPAWAVMGTSMTKVMRLYEKAHIPIPSRETDSFDLDDISRRYESTSTRPETNSFSGEDVRFLVCDLDRGLPGKMNGQEQRYL